MAQADAAEAAESRSPARGLEPHSLRARPPRQHVIITGRNAPSALVQYADLVTEMNLVKHPYDAGIEAQPGIEF